MVNWLPKGKISELDFMHGFTERSLAVYVMVSGMSCKVGFSGNPGLRCAGLQASSIGDVCVFWAGRLPAAEARKLEKVTHILLKRMGCHIRGEWFHILPHRAVNLIKRTAIERGYKIVPDLFFGYNR